MATKGTNQTKTTPTTPKAPTLYWSEQGEIGCDQKGHAPYKGSDSWRRDRWTKMKPADVDAMAKEIGRATECESCRNDRLRNSPFDVRFSDGQPTERVENFDCAIEAIIENIAKHTPIEKCDHDSPFWGTIDLTGESYAFATRADADKRDNAFSVATVVAVGTKGGAA